MNKHLILGISPNPEKVIERMKKAGAEWTSEGWIAGGDLDLSSLELTRLPLIKSVGGNLDCSTNKLASLKGAPKSVGGSFDCCENKLTSLTNAPKKVGRNFWCGWNQLTSLRGAPKNINGDFVCIYNQLASLEGIPKIIIESLVIDELKGE